MREELRQLVLTLITATPFPHPALRATFSRWVKENKCYSGFGRQFAAHFDGCDPMTKSSLPPAQICA